MQDVRLALRNLRRSPGFTASSLRTAALNKSGESTGESLMDEETLMSPQEVASIVLDAIEKHKRNVIMSFFGKRTVFYSRFLPSFADKLIHKYFFQEGKLIR